MSLSQEGGQATVQITGGTGAIVAGSNFGFASSARSGAGVYSLVTNRSFSFPVISFCILGGAGNANLQVAPNADKVTFAVTTFVAAVATDENFVLRIEEAIT
jgi:hypothetical protein